MVDIGRGEPIVVVPGLQGRWEWQRPAIEALARRHRVIAYSLCDERASGFSCDPDGGFENYVDQLGAVLERAQVDRATLVGISYGGLIAAEFASRFPARVSSLVLASALSMPWSPDARARFYMRAPRLLFPMFALAAPFRMRREIESALPRWIDRVDFARASVWRFLRAPLSPSRMTRRLRWIETHAFADHSRIVAPVMLITGEPELDRVVPVAVSRRYLERIPQARHEVLRRTGHLGVLTRPDAFATLIESFIDGHSHVRRAEADFADHTRISHDLMAPSAPDPLEGRTSQASRSDDDAVATLLSGELRG